MNPKLVALSGPIAETAFALPESEITIGRSASNDLCIPDRILSRQHCAIRKQDECYSIRDLGSRHGTLVNGVPISQQVLNAGDQIELGNSVFVFLAGGEDARPQGNRAELSDSGEMPGAQTLLRREDSVYANLDTTTPDFPQNTRVARDLSTLLKIAQNISAVRDSESLAWQLLGMVFDVVPAERGAMIAFADDPEEPSWSVAWDRVMGPGVPVRISRTVVRRVLEEQSGLMIRDISSTDVLRGSVSFREFPVHSLICVPLTISGRISALMYVDTRDANAHFDDNHLQIMTAIASIASLAMENIAHFEALKRENQNLRSQISLEHNMIGASAPMREVFQFIQRVAPTESTVLILGESGTGKELVARAVHRNSPRAKGPFIAINCAAIAESLLESELFGHEKGAFTGAVAQKKGKIEAASGGTIFLDEVGELAAALQAKLLRVLQEREFERVGGIRPVKADIRVVAATNRNLQEAVQAGGFRKDLFYRLNVVAINVPPLRERRDDIPDLVEYFIQKTARKCNTRSKSLSPQARSSLMNYDWPGNVRELENAIERALVLGSTDSILVEDLPDAIFESATSAGMAGTKYAGAVKDTKKQLILEALEQTSGSYIEAAKVLGLHPNSLLRLIRRLDLKPDAKRAGSPEIP
jgi:transcriptional regulator with GAF, ATPase, and Fis domain